MFSLQNGLMSISQSVFDTQNAMERNVTATKIKKTSESEGCPHCDKLRRFLVKGKASGEMNGDVKEQNGRHVNGDACSGGEAGQCGKDVTDAEPIPENERPSLTASVSHSSVDYHDSAESPELRSKLPDQYLDRFMSLSLYSGKELGEEIGELMERLKQSDMNDGEINKYLEQRELDIRNGKTSRVYIESDGVKYELNLEIYTRASQSLKGLRHIIRGTDKCMLAKDLGIREEDMILMINSECVVQWPHKRVVECLSEALKNGEDIALVIFRDLPGNDRHIYLTVRGQVNILVSRGDDPIEIMVVNSLTREIDDNRVLGLKRTPGGVIGPIFIWQHELMGASAQYSLSINGTKELYMDLTYATNEKAHWTIYEYDGDVYTFDNGLQKGESNPHKIWLVRNKDTGEFIAINDRTKDVYLSRQGILPDKDDNMPIDDRMLVAHVPEANTFLFESLSIMDHFLCVDAGDKHKVDISKETEDNEMNRFAFQLISVAEVIGTRGRLETITRLHKYNLDRKDQDICLSHLTDEGGPSFERLEVTPLHCEGPWSPEDEYDIIPSVKQRWPPASKETNGTDDRPVLRRPGMHKFVPPQESKAEKEGVAIDGQVRNLTDKFEFTTPSTRASCAVERGHVKIVSETFR